MLSARSLKATTFLTATLSVLSSCGTGEKSVSPEPASSSQYTEVPPVVSRPQVSEQVFNPIQGIDPKQYSGVVMLVSLQADSLAGCTATRVSPNFYLTASHCWAHAQGAGQRPPYNGVFNGNPINICPSGYTASYPNDCYPSDYIFVISNTQLTDIMLVHTATPLDSRYGFVPIYSMSSEWGLKNDVEVDFGGFGLTGPLATNSGDPAVFRFGRSPQSTDPKDADEGDLAAVRDGKEFLFGIAKGASESCHGDSGGPVFYTGTRIVIGIQTHTSLKAGADCGLQGSDSYATRMDYWYDKVTSILSDQDNYNPPPMIFGQNDVTSDSAFKAFNPAVNYDASMFVPGPIVVPTTPPSGGGTGGVGGGPIQL